MKNWGCYDSLSKLPIIRKSYTGKFLLIAFVGTHIPLIGMVVVAAFASEYIHWWHMVSAALVLTLTATAITLFMLNRLLLPIQESVLALKDYYEKRTVPKLPSHYEDEAGQLMAGIQQCIGSLDEALEEKKDFAAMLSHDLRTPFTQLLGMIELIRLSDSPEETGRYCDHIVLEGQKQLNFIGEVLEVLRSNSNALSTINRSPVMVSNLIGEALERIQATAAQKNVRVEHSIDQDVQVHVDKEHLIHAIQNLLTNAVKFSDSGKKVKLESISDHGCVVLLVKDEGIGFDPEGVDQLFIKFGTGRTGTAGEKSTGFGLYSVKKTVELHGGTIEATSKGPNTGATFSIKIPVN